MIKALRMRRLPFLMTLILLFAVGCASPKKQSSPLPVQQQVQHLDEPDRVVKTGDLLRLTLRLPGRSLGVLEQVQKTGDVATPDGSLIKADGLKLSELRKNFLELYQDLPTYEGVSVDVYVSSSPYAVVRLLEEAPSDGKAGKAKSPPIIYRRNFEVPMTVWEAIQKEGGIPINVNPSQIHILRRGLSRKTLDCHRDGGSPDGRMFLESGDYIFLVPEDVPVSQIFDQD